MRRYFRIQHSYASGGTLGTPGFVPTGKMEDFLAPTPDASTFVLFMQTKQKRAQRLGGSQIAGVSKTI
jgi:hypothetical protein